MIVIIKEGQSLLARSQGFAHVCMSMSPGYFDRKEDKQNQNIFLVFQCPIPHLLIAYTQQLGILQSNQENHEHQKYF